MKALTKQLNKVNIFNEPLSVYETIRIGNMFHNQKYLVMFGWLLYAKIVFFGNVPKAIVFAAWIRQVLSIVIAFRVYDRFCKKTVLSIFGIVKTSYFMISILFMELILVLLNVLPDVYVLSAIVWILHIGGV